MPTFIHQAIYGPAIKVYGDGEHISDMVYVEDVARALVACIGSRRVWACGPRRSNRVIEIARKVQAEVFRQAGTFTPITRIPMPASEIPGTTAVTEDMAVEPVVSLKHGIEMTVRSYLQQRET
jgi:nucleoside-diphosphate-sugar epimerase